MAELSPDDSEARARWDDRLGAYVDVQGTLDVLRLRPQTEPPWPTSDNPMLGYLVDRSGGDRGRGRGRRRARVARVERVVRRRGRGAVALRALPRRRLTSRTRRPRGGRRGFARPSNPPRRRIDPLACRENGPSSSTDQRAARVQRGQTWCQRPWWLSRVDARRGAVDAAARASRRSPGASAASAAAARVCASPRAPAPVRVRFRRRLGCRRSARRGGRGRLGDRRGGRGFRRAQRRRSGDDLHPRAGVRFGLPAARARRGSLGGGLGGDDFGLGRPDRRGRGGLGGGRCGFDGTDASATRLPQPARCSPQPPTGWASGARRASSYSGRCGGRGRRGRGAASRCLRRTTRCRRR